MRAGLKKLSRSQAHAFKEAHRAHRAAKKDGKAPASSSSSAPSKHESGRKKAPRSDGEGEGSKLARVLYDFTGDSPIKALVKRGDVVTVLGYENADWAKIALIDDASVEVGERRGGIAPFAYIEVLPAPDVCEEVEALYTFEATSDAHLGFTVGTTLYVVGSVSGWCKGWTGSRFGRFPENYVKAKKAGSAGSASSRRKGGEKEKEKEKGRGMERSSSSRRQAKQGGDEKLRAALAAAEARVAEADGAAAAAKEEAEAAVAAAADARAEHQAVALELVAAEGTQ